MSKKSNPAMIGGFVLGAITLALAGIMVFGSGRFFRETYRYTLYFDSDVSGLSEGANVKLKGVQIGTVSSVLLSAGDASTLTAEGEKFYVPVVIQLDADRTTSLGSVTKPDPATIAALVARGLRAQLASESFVTGVHYVKLDLFPGSKGLSLGDRVKSPYPEIPTLPSQFEEAQTKAAQFFADLEKLDMQGLIEEMKSMSAAVRQASESANGVMNPLQDQVGPTLVEFRAALADLRQTATSTRTLLQPGSPLVVGMEQALNDTSVAAKTLRDLAAMLERQPDALLRGRGSQSPGSGADPGSAKGAKP